MGYDNKRLPLREMMVKYPETRRSGPEKVVNIFGNDKMTIVEVTV